MKVIVIDNNYEPVRVSSPKVWYLIADSAISNTGKPFYIPENCGKTVVSLIGTVRISRLGKNISEKFASRYYTEYAPALHFKLPDLEEFLRESGLPQDASRSFDRSLIIGDFLPIEDKETLRLRINGEDKAEFNFGLLHKGVEKVLSEVSKMNTMKIGDILVPGLSGFIEIREGDFLEVMKGEERAFHVKVK